MRRYASVCFGDVLATGEREAATRVVTSAAAAVTSWKATARRTYLTVEADEGVAQRLSAAFSTAVVDVPALGVLRVVPDAERALPRLLHALGGDGRPDGVRDAYRDGAAVVVEVDVSRTRLSFVVALIDAELRTAPGRTIEPLIAFDDAALTALAGDLLGTRDLDATRLIEPYVARVMAE